MRKNKEVQLGFGFKILILLVVGIVLYFVFSDVSNTIDGLENSVSDLLRYLNKKVNIFLE